MMNLQNKKVVFVTGCLLCPYLQAIDDDKNILWTKLVREFLLEQNISVVQMNCPESSFSDEKCGLIRKPHGVTYYEKLSGFSEYCRGLADREAARIEDFLKAGYEVVTVLGVEHSPTCAVNYIYMGKYGNVHRRGIYFEELYSTLGEKGIFIPFIGINRRFPTKAIKEMRILLEEKEVK